MYRFAVLTTVMWYDYCLLFQERGLADISQFGYYPYRDDGKEIWNEIERFASALVHM